MENCKSYIYFNSYWKKKICEICVFYAGLHYKLYDGIIFKVKNYTLVWFFSSYFLHRKCNISAWLVCSVCRKNVKIRILYATNLANYCRKHAYYVRNIRRKHDRIPWTESIFYVDFSAYFHADFFKENCEPPVQRS